MRYPRVWFRPRGILTLFLSLIITKIPPFASSSPFAFLVCVLTTSEMHLPFTSTPFFRCNSKQTSNVFLFFFFPPVNYYLGTVNLSPGTFVNWTLRPRVLDNFVFSYLFADFRFTVHDNQSAELTYLVGSPFPLIPQFTQWGKVCECIL